MKEIAVLGAGPMGLAVAYQLVKEGHRPVIYEAGDRIGGMTASFDFDGLNIERYYHFHCTSDTAFFQVLKELGLQEKLHWVATKMGFYYGGRIQAWGNPWALLTFSGLNLIDKVRYGWHAFMATRRDHWQDLDQLRAIPWIENAVGKRAFSVLWSKLFQYKFYEYAGELSAAWIWSRIRRIGRSRYNIFREKLGYLEGGSDTLLEAMRCYIVAGGGQIRLNAAVTRVEVEAGRLTGITVNGEFHGYDSVISTIPLPYIPQLIPGLPESVLEQYRALKNVAVACVIVKLRRRLTDNFWLNVNDPSMEIPGLVEYSNLRPLTEHIVYVPFYMPADHPKFKLPEEAFAAEVQGYLKRINPDLKDADLLAVKVSKYRFSQPVCGPGFLQSLPPWRSPVRGLYVADTSYYYPEDRGISESIGFGRDMARAAVSGT